MELPYHRELVILAVLTVLGTLVGSRDMYLGCFYMNTYAGSSWIRSNVNSTSMDVNICRNICSQDSVHMSLIGLNDGQYCYCLTFSDQEMKYDLVKRADDECNTLCSGAPRCGGRNVLAVYDAKLQSFLGCYNNPSPEISIDLVDGTIGEEVTLTACYRYCNDRRYNYNYTALMNGNECYCMSYLPSSTDTTNEMCFTYGHKCAGAQRCGGKNTLSIWKTIDDSSTSTYASLIRTGSSIRNSSRHIGCKTSENDTNKLWWRGPYRNELNLSVNWCLGICWQQGFRFSGLNKGLQCYCFTNDQVLRDLHNAEATKCDVKCKGDIKCGGNGNLVIYNSSSSTFIGCFQNREQTRLGLVSRDPLLPLTQKSCIFTCRESFKYAGIEGGSQCYCGNRIPDVSSKTTDSVCLIYGTDCPGADTCGGSDGLDVWEMLEAHGDSVEVTQVPRQTSRSSNMPTDTAENIMNTSVQHNGNSTLYILILIVVVTAVSTLTLYVVIQRYRKFIRNRSRNYVGHIYSVVEKEKDLPVYMEVTG